MQCENRVLIKQPAVLDKGAINIAGLFSTPQERDCSKLYTLS
jgi:hypothetical protein